MAGVTRWSAVLLAGSRSGGTGEGLLKGDKAVIAVAGVAMVLRPLSALLDSGLVTTVAVLAQEPDKLRSVLPDDRRVWLKRSAGTIAETIAGLIERREIEYPVLVTTADHALLSPSTVAEFAAAAAGADLAIGVVAENVVRARFPRSKRTWIGFKGGRYTGANLFAFGSDKVMAAIDQWRGVEQDRKKGWRVLAALGPALLIGAVLKLRTIQQSADAVGRRLGMSIRIVELGDAKAAIDIDKPADLELAEAIVRGEA